MATRKGDVITYKSKTRELQEGAEAQEAAFDDEWTQAAKLGTSIMDKWNIAKGFAKTDKEETKESDNEAFEYDTYEQAMDLGGPSREFVNSMAKTKLGDAYIEGQNYRIGEDGNFEIDMYSEEGGLLNLKPKKTDMGLKTPDTSNLFPERKEPVEVTLSNIQAANQAILDGKAETYGPWTPTAFSKAKEELQYVDGKPTHTPYYEIHPYLASAWEHMFTPWYIKDGYSSAKEARAAQNAERMAKYGR